MIRGVLREALLLAVLAAVPASVLGVVQLQWRKTVPPGEGEVSAATARLWGEKVLWVDARARAKWERKKIPGAVLLNGEEWDALVAKFLDEWDPEKAVVVYGDGAQDDAAVGIAHRLKEELKLDGVWVLQGGWDAWQQR
jgi:rhodanese-related sulfurtransferase